MSYNSYHKQGVPSVMSRGRGFSSRGSSFRGRGGDSQGGTWSSGNGSPRGRGGYSGPSRGRFNWYKEHSSSFDSRSRYPTSSSGGERYSSRGRGSTDDSYRRYRGSEGSSYAGTRDHSHHRSPDSQRKRMRTEHGYTQASSSRRSHEGSYGAEYPSRYSYPEEKGGYSEERRSYREERRTSATGFRDRSREEYPHRKSEHLDSGMPPPSSTIPRHVGSPRGTFRGRPSTRARGMTRMLLARKRPIMDSYSVRKRIVPIRSHADVLRRLKIQKLRRIKEAALAYARKDKVKDKTTEDISDADDDEEEKDETWEDEVEKEEEEDEELEEGETPDKEKVVKVKVAKPAVVKEEPEEGEEVDDEDEDADTEQPSPTTPMANKVEAKSDGSVHVTIKQDLEARAACEEPVIRKRRLPPPPPPMHPRPYIRLSCPHCFSVCKTFKEHMMHLYSAKHTSAMRRLSMKHKQTLAGMRMSQRQNQRMVEESEEVQDSIRTLFCPICKLNYRQLKSRHQASDSHRAMKRFLNPYCHICQIRFKSPMQYEDHVCSLDHIKKKQRMNEQNETYEREVVEDEEVDEEEDDDEASDMEDDKDLNMDNFMILDSVGTVDGTDPGEMAGEVKCKVEREKGEDSPKTKASELILGSEYVKLVEVYFCELCRVYLPRMDQRERAYHCRTRTHLQRYVRYQDDRTLRREAERIHRKEMAKEQQAKEQQAKKVVAIDDKPEQKAEEEASGEPEAQAGEAGKESPLKNEPVKAAGDADTEAGIDEKLWADVDKDLGELLRVVEPGNKSSDEDEDSRAEGGRYDRFRYSEKGTTDPPQQGEANAKPEVAASEPEVVEVVDNKEAAETCIISVSEESQNPVPAPTNGTA